MAFLDELDPPNVQQALITLSLARPLETPRALHAIGVLVTLTGEAVTTGLVLPLEVRIVDPSRKIRRVRFTRTVPTQFSFKPLQGGLYGVVLTELGHNLWFGTLRVQVEGDKLSSAFD